MRANVQYTEDQFSKRYGTPIPFLGKEAKTVRTVAGIVQKTECHVLSSTSIMQRDGTYDIWLTVVPGSDLEGLSEEDAVAAYQTLHNDTISQQIRTYPENWFGWFHRRFRGYADYGR